MLWSALQTLTKLHATSHAASFLQTQKLKLTNLASLLAETRDDSVLAGQWQSLAGIFTTLPSAQCPERV